jgi:Protein of unknown function (DUF2786)
MDTDRQKALDRIIKLLALANGTSFEGEADTTRRMAEELIAKHKIDVSQAQLCDQFVIGEYVPWGKQSLWEKIIAAAVAALCGCAFFYEEDPKRRLSSFQIP